MSGGGLRCTDHHCGLGVFRDWSHGGGASLNCFIVIAIPVDCDGHTVQFNDVASSPQG